VCLCVCACLAVKREKVVLCVWLSLCVYFCERDLGIQGNYETNKDDMFFLYIYRTTHECVMSQI